MTGDTLACTLGKFLALILASDFINATSYITLILPLLQDCCFFYYPVYNQASDKNDDN